MWRRIDSSRRLLPLVARTRLRPTEQVQGPKRNWTAWEYLTGEPYTGEIYVFGTPIIHMISGPVQGGVISDRWFDGTWICLQFSSGEHIVATTVGRVIRARAVHPRPDTVKITRETLNNIKIRPWDPSEVINQGSEDKPSPSTEETQPPQAAEPVPRSFRITQEDPAKFNYTNGVPKVRSTEER